ncbi:GNAT family N-acetyltransferase [Mycoplasmatota bacterium]|nr:GNAT family N-acetyltransferase [Mycoplasmatota bacterium]
MITITHTNDLNEEDKKTIIDGLVKHNEKFTGHYDVSYVKLILKDKEVVVGGLFGALTWDCLFVNDYWVDEAYRNQGLGKYLLNQAEKITLEHDINYMTIHAIDEKLKDFLINRGYQVYGYLDDRPIGHRYNFLEKHLRNNILKEINIPNEISLVKTPSKIETDQFQEQLAHEKEALVGKHFFEFVYIIAKNENRKLIGGLVGYIGYDYLYISTLWVHEDYRKKKLGKQLVTKAENYALDMKINQAFLGTTDFQAKPFYEKLGYEVFGVNKNLPKGFNNYSMKKIL